MKTLSSFIISCLLLAQTVNLFAHGDTHERIAEINQLLLEDPDNAMLFYKRACLYLDHNELTNALYDFDKSSELNPQLLITYLRRAEVFYKLELYDEALKELNYYLNSETEKTEFAYLYRARSLAKLEQFDKSVKDYKKVLDSNIPELPDVYHELAKLYLQEEPPNYSNAIEILQNGINRLGDIQSFHIKIITLHKQSNKPNEALMHVDKLIEKMPRKETWYKRKADMLVSLNRVTEAKTEYNNALNAVSVLSEHRKRTEFVINLQREIEESLRKLQ